MLHFPPFCDRERASGFTERLEQSGVNIVVYGHLHGEANKYAFEGEKTVFCITASRRTSWTLCRSGSCSLTRHFNLGKTKHPFSRVFLFVVCCYPAAFSRSARAGGL